MTTPGTTTTAEKDTSATPEDLRLAVRAATLYYLDGLTQAEVAQRLGVSRPTAGRLVARARAQGIVRIEVAVPPSLRDDLHADLERALEERYANLWRLYVFVPAEVAARAAAVSAELFGHPSEYSAGSEGSAP